MLNRVYLTFAVALIIPLGGIVLPCLTKSQFMIEWVQVFVELCAVVLLTE